MQQARSSLLAAHSGSQFLATQAALLQGIHYSYYYTVFEIYACPQDVKHNTIHKQ